MQINLSSNYRHTFPRPKCRINIDMCQLAFDPGPTINNPQPTGASLSPASSSTTRLVPDVLPARLDDQIPLLPDKMENLRNIVAQFVESHYYMNVFADMRMPFVSLTASIGCVRESLDEFARWVLSLLLHLHRKRPV
jgi:hypothetical protein